jgi:hypothetical protein
VGRTIIGQRARRVVTRWASALCVLALAGCQLSESAAKEKLEADGLREVVLERVDDGFTFTATNDAGDRCTGRISGTSGTGSSNTMVTKTCTSSAPR